MRQPWLPYFLFFSQSHRKPENAALAQAHSKPTAPPIISAKNKRVIVKPRPLLLNLREVEVFSCLY